METNYSQIQRIIDSTSINKNKYPICTKRLQQIADSDKPLTLLNVVPLLGYKELLQLNALIKNNPLRLVDNNYKV